MQPRIPRFTIRRMIVAIALMALAVGQAAELFIHRPKRATRLEEIADYRRGAEALREFSRADGPDPTGRQEAIELAELFDRYAEAIEGGTTIDRDELRAALDRFEAGVAVLAEE